MNKNHEHKSKEQHRDTLADYDKRRRMLVIFGVVMILIAITIYIFTLDEAIRPAGDAAEEQAPAATE